MKNDDTVRRLFEAISSKRQELLVQAEAIDIAIANQNYQEVTTAVQNLQRVHSEMKGLVDQLTAVVVADQIIGSAQDHQIDAEGEDFIG